MENLKKQVIFVIFVKDLVQQGCLEEAFLEVKE